MFFCSPDDTPWDGGELRAAFCVLIQRKVVIKLLMNNDCSGYMII